MEEEFIKLEQDIQQYESEPNKNQNQLNELLVKTEKLREELHNIKQVFESIKESMNNDQEEDSNNVDLDKLMDQMNTIKNNIYQEKDIFNLIKYYEEQIIMIKKFKGYCKNKKLEIEYL